MSFIEELKRRNVFRVGVAYVLMGWVLLQGADFVLDVAGTPDWVIRSLIVVVGIGLPVALFFAWAFEVTPEGIKRESDVDRTQSLTPQTARKLDRAIIVFLGLAVVLLLGDRYLSTREQTEPIVTADPQAAEPTVTINEAPEKSIAVLPFVNMSSDPEQEFFSDGISEEILNSLAQLGELKVAGRTSSFSFKNRNEDLRDIGQTLGVQHILEGSVRKSGERVRITAQLIHVEDGFHLWSETYDRDLTDVFAVQDDIANQILTALKTALSVTPNPMRDSLDQASYDKYLKARQLARKRDIEPFQQAIRLLEEVNESAPEFAPAWVQRANAVYGLHSYGGPGNLEEVLVEVRALLERAEELDPTDPELLASLGNVHLMSGEPHKGLQLLERALAINPSLIDANNWAWRAYIVLGQYQKAYAINRRIRSLDPFYLPTSGNIDYDFMILGLTEEFSDHVSQIKSQLTEIDERYPHQGELLLAIAQAEYGRAVNIWNPELNRFPFHAVFVGEGLLRLGEPQQAAQIAQNLPFEMLALSRVGLLEESEFVKEGAVTQDLFLAWPYLAALADAGRWAEVVAFYDEHIVELYGTPPESLEDFGTEVVAPLFNFTFALGRLAEAMRETGDEARFEHFQSLFSQSLIELDSEGVNNAGFHFSRAYNATLMGDRDEALAYLARMNAAGSFPPPDFTSHWQTFKPLQGDPRFEDITAQMTTRRNQQRAELGLLPIDERDTE